MMDRRMDGKKERKCKRGKGMRRDGYQEGWGGGGNGGEERRGGGGKVRGEGGKGREEGGKGIWREGKNEER